MFPTILSNRFELKSVSLAFLFAEIFDLMTTYGGLTIFPQLWEANPLPTSLIGWYPALLAKTLVTIIVIVLLEKVEKWPKIVWVIPFTASLPVMWNLICILAEILL